MEYKTGTKYDETGFTVKPIIALSVVSALTLQEFLKSPAERLKYQEALDLNVSNYLKDHPDWKSEKEQVDLYFLELMFGKTVTLPHIQILDQAKGYAH